jgi:hypothetical protein
MISTRLELIGLLPKNSIAAECGVAEGNFSFDLLQNGVGKLYSVDAWKTIEGVTGDGNFPQEWHDKNYDTAKKRLSKFGDKSIILRGLTFEMAKEVPDNTLDLLYLDAAHYKEGVKADLEAWYPKVKSGGIVAGHDYLNKAYGVFDAVNEFIYGITEIITIPENNNNDASFYFIKP